MPAATPVGAFPNYGPTPDELAAAAPQPAPRARGPVLQAVLSLVLLIAATTLIVVGVAGQWGAYPAVLAAGLVLLLVAVLFGVSS